ncbi:MAG TPA: hypothetical protein VK728_07645 [Candidatus Sulfotelmatobacter sp.]|jgi:hypothetical protein|nr:hypothetical protein [Candidatus Sulfotelmatobacter sp.]
MKFRLILAATALLYVQPVAHAQDFAGAMKQIFGKQYPHYQWLNYPLNDFGVGTAYSDKKAQADPQKFLCATFTCLEITPQPQDKEACYAPGGPVGAADCPLTTLARSQTIYYANVACGTSADAKLSENKTIALKAILPVLLQAIGLSATVDDETIASATVTLTKACDRRLLPVPFNNFISQLKSDAYGLRQAQMDQKLIIIRDDIVLTSFEVTVTKGSKLSADLDAKLSLQGLMSNGLKPQTAKSTQTPSASVPKGQNGPEVSVQYAGGNLDVNAQTGPTQPQSANQAGSGAQKTSQTPGSQAAAGSAQPSNGKPTTQAASNTKDASQIPACQAGTVNAQPSNGKATSPAVSNVQTPSQTSTAKAQTSPEVSVGFCKDSNDQYHLKSTAPLIIGIAAVKQPPSAGVLPGKLPSWNGWTATAVDLDLAKKP